MILAVDRRAQYEQESETWAKLLNSFKQENAFLKTRLSIVIDNKDDKEFLVLAEYFQNQFLLKDEFIRELIKDVYEQEMFLKEPVISDILFGTITKKQEKLRKEMRRFEKDFYGLKDKFNQAVA